MGELGPAHAVSRHGDKELKKWRKLMHLDELAATKEDTATLLRAAEATGCVSVFGEALETAKKSLGAAHPDVETARQTYKQFRSHHQRSEYYAMVDQCTEVVAEACESNDSERIEEVLHEVTSKLGMSHPLIEYGRNYLLTLRKQFHRDYEERMRQESTRLISDAVQDVEECLARLEEEVEGVLLRGVSPRRLFYADKPGV